MEIKYERYKNASGNLISVLLNVPDAIKDDMDKLIELMKEEVDLQKKLTGKKLVADFNFDTVNADYVNNTFTIRIIMSETSEELTLKK